SIANASLDFPSLRWVMEKAIGISTKRSLPHYAYERFDRWFAKHTSDNSITSKHRHVILWDDTFVRYHEPHIGIAAVKVLEALGFEVSLVHGRKCCGRPAFSQGNLDYAAKLGRHNVELLSLLQNASPARTSNTPVL